MHHNDVPTRGAWVLAICKPEGSPKLLYFRTIWPRTGRYVRSMFRSGIGSRSAARPIESTVSKKIQEQLCCDELCHHVQHRVLVSGLKGSVADWGSNCGNVP